MSHAHICRWQYTRLSENSHCWYPDCWLAKIFHTNNNVQWWLQDLDTQLHMPTLTDKLLWAYELFLTVLYILIKHFFNNAIWPTFIQINVGHIAKNRSSVENMSEKQFLSTSAVHSQPKSNNIHSTYQQLLTTMEISACTFLCHPYILMYIFMYTWCMYKSHFILNKSITSFMFCYTL